MDPNSEIEVIKAAARGDIDSFAALYNRYYSSMAAIGLLLRAELAHVEGKAHGLNSR